MIDNWNNLDLRTYSQVYEITSNEIMSEEDKTLRIAAILGGITFDELLSQPISKTEEMVKCTTFMFERPKPKKAKSEYTLNGRKYTLLKDATELSTSQYIDYQTVIVENFEEHIVDLISIVLLPKGREYNDGYDREQVIEDIKSMSVTEALGITDFFLKKYRRLLRRSLLYSSAAMQVAVMEAPKEMRKEMKTAQKKYNEEVKKLLFMCGYLSLKQLLK